MRWPNDTRLAEEVQEIDLFLGGHDHDYKLMEVKVFIWLFPELYIYFCFVHLYICVTLKNIYILQLFLFCPLVILSTQISLTSKYLQGLDYLEFLSQILVF